MEFAPMPRRRTGTLTRTMALVSASVRGIEGQREPHAEFWDEWNALAANEDGPLWVALGDSSSQGIGVVDPNDGWVPQMVDRLRSHTGEPWRVLNLSMTGAQLPDVLEHQVSRLNLLRDAGQPPALVTHLAGANDLLAPATWIGTRQALGSVLDSLPDRAVVARIGVSTRFNARMARSLTSLIEQQAALRPFHLFWPWDWPSRDGLAEDNWHPSARGYEYMLDLIWEPIRASLGLISQSQS